MPCKVQVIVPPSLERPQRTETSPAQRPQRPLQPPRKVGVDAGWHPTSPGEGALGELAGLSLHLKEAGAALAAEGGPAMCWDLPRSRREADFRLLPYNKRQLAPTTRFLLPFSEKQGPALEPWTFARSSTLARGAQGTLASLRGLTAGCLRHKGDRGCGSLWPSASSSPAARGDSSPGRMAPVDSGWRPCDPGRYVLLARCSLQGSAERVRQKKGKIYITRASVI